MDTFAFAMLAYETTMRSQPYVDVNALAVGRKVEKGERPDLANTHANLTADIADIIRACWDHRPERRPPMLTVAAQLMDTATKLPAIAVKLALSADDLKVYSALWTEAPTTNEALPGADALRFFATSGLAIVDLKIIWDASSTTAPISQLSRGEFFAALKLIAVKQNGGALNPAAFALAGQPLPKIGVNNGFPAEEQRRKAAVDAAEGVAAAKAEGAAAAAEAKAAEEAVAAVKAAEAAAAAEAKAAQEAAAKAAEAAAAAEAKAAGEAAAAKVAKTAAAAKAMGGSLPAHESLEGFAIPENSSGRGFDMTAVSNPFSASAMGSSGRGFGGETTEVARSTPAAKPAENKILLARPGQKGPSDEEIAKQATIERSIAEAFNKIQAAQGEFLAQKSDFDYGNFDGKWGISVPRYHDKSDGGKSHIFFEVNMECRGEKWTIYRRYSQFDSLHKRLKKVMPGMVSNIKFPPTKWKVDAAFLMERKLQLETYLRALIEMTHNSATSPFYRTSKRELEKMLPFFKADVAFA